VVTGHPGERLGGHPAISRQEHAMTPISDRAGILRAQLSPKPTPAPQPVAPAPSSPQGLGVVRGNDHRLGDFSGRLA
jgi:hypothetical protein